MDLPAQKKYKSVSREYQNAWRQLPNIKRRKRLAQKLRRLWRSMENPLPEKPKLSPKEKSRLWRKNNPGYNARKQKEYRIKKALQELNTSSSPQNHARI